MTDATPVKAEFRALLAGHFELYPGTTMTEATVVAWWSEIGDFPLEVLPEAFRKARAASPQFPATAPQVKAIAEVDAAHLAKLRAERRQERLFPAPSEKPGQALHDFWVTCDAALRECTPGVVDEQHKTLFIGVAVALHRFLGKQDCDDVRLWGQWWWSDCKQRKLDADACLHGMRKAPRYFRRPPSLGMVRELITGEQMGGYPPEIVAPDGDALEAAR